MALRKQTITHNDIPPKCKANNTAGCAVLPPAVNQHNVTKDSGSSSPQGAPASVQQPLLEGQILQMLIDMKE